MIILAIISLSIINVSAYTVFSDNTSASGADTQISLTLNESEKDYVSAVETYIDNNAIKSKTYLSNDQTVSLVYDHSRLDSNGDQKNIYVDQSNNKYVYGAEGEFIGFSQSSDTYMNTVSEMQLQAKSEKNVTITEEEAIAIAYQTARNTFGNKFDIVEFDHTTIDGLDGSYYVFFSQKLGKDGFIEGIRCFVNVLNNREIYSCKMPNYDELKDFDTAKLDSMTEEDLLKCIQIQLEETYGDALQGFSFEKAKLKSNDSKYCLEVKLNIILSEGDQGNIQFTDTYLLDIN